MAVGVVGVVLAALVVGAGQLGAWEGRPPPDLGVKDGRLKPPSATDNSVSSQAALHAGHPMQQAAMIAPLRVPGPPDQALDRVRAAALALPGASLVSAREGYLHLQFRTRWMGFVDDTEFWADPTAGVVQVRSASRLGQKDFGVNRQRIEQIRAALGG